ncbi:MAG: hypothetical protein ACJ75Z_01495 [Solirubrobacterales bacterium]
MRTRAVICVAAFALACAIPAIAGGSTSSYKGGFDPSGTLKFTRAKKKHTPPAVGGFSFSRFPLACDRGANTESTSLNFSVLVKDRKFHAKGVIPAGSQHPDSELILKGEFSRSHHRAHGTMRVFGPKVPVDDQAGGSSDQCDSGNVAWTAHVR